jgi:hypothetical protein
LPLTRHKTPILARQSLSIPISAAPSQYQNSHYSVGISRRADPRDQVLGRTDCLRALSIRQQAESKERERINGNGYVSGHPGLAPVINNQAQRRGLLASAGAPCYALFLNSAATGGCGSLFT